VDDLLRLTPFRFRPAAELPHLSRQSSFALSLIESRGIAQSVAGSAICGADSNVCAVESEEVEEYGWLVTFEEVDSDDPKWAFLRRT
jgi:hypothetical protein